MRQLKRIIPLLIGLAVFGWTWERTQAPREPRKDIKVTITLRTDVSDDLELFYDTTGKGFGGAWSMRQAVRPSSTPQQVAFHLPLANALHGLRIDPGDHAVPIDLYELIIEGPYRKITWDPDDIREHFTRTNDLDSLSIDPVSRALLLPCNGPDPYLATITSIGPELQNVLSPVRPILAPFVKAMLVGLVAALLGSVLLTIRISRPRFPAIKRPRKWSAFLLLALCSSGIFLLVRTLVNGINIRERESGVDVVGTFQETDETQIFFAAQPDHFTKDAFVSSKVMGSRRPQLVRSKFPPRSAVHFLRFDPGMRQDTVWLDSLRFHSGTASETWSAQLLKERLTPNDQVASIDLVDGRLRIIARGNDPFLRIQADLGPLYARLYKKSGNGPLPLTIAVIAVLFFLFGSGKVLVRWLDQPGTKSTDLVVSGLFLAVITVPLMVTITGTEPELENTEKRLLAQEPPFELERALDFPLEYTTYYEENFGMRKVLFRWNSLFYAKVLHTSPLPERTLFGKEDWLFYVRPGAMEKYQELCDIPDDQLAWVADRLERRRQWLAAQGIHYVLMIPPEKSSVYGDKLPARIKRFGEPSCLDRLLNELKERSSLDVVDIRGTLGNARRIHDVYYTSDTHWNPIGAWYGYSTLMDILHKADTTIAPPRSFDGYYIQTDTNDQGDLAQQIGLNDVFTRITPLMIAKDSTLARDAAPGSYANSGFLKYPPIVKEVPGSTKPRLLMFRDSFTVYMIPSISEHFSRSAYVWTPIFIPEIVLEEHPDVVVHEVMELFLSDLLQDDLFLPPLPPPPPAP